MLLIPGYSMLSATATVLMLSIIFLILSHQSNKNYMRLWGMSWLLYSAMFLLDFLNLRAGVHTINYTMLRQIIALVGSFVFLLGTHRFFQKKTPALLIGSTALSILLIVVYPFSHLIYTLALIPNIIYCAGILIYSGCMFISYSWTQNLPEKILASFFIIIWGIFINHFGFSSEHLSLAIFTYFISVFTVNILILYLIIIYFKKTRFLDHKQANRYRLLVENSADTMFLYNYKIASFEYVSPTISDLIGISDKELYQTPTRFFDHVEIKRKASLILDLFSAPITDSGMGVLCLQGKESGETWSEIHYLPICDATGSVVAVEGIIRDITENKNMEEDLKEVERVKKEFLENISHEIKTPVTLIQGYTESLLEGVVPVPSTDTYLRMINSKAIMLSTLVDDLAQVSKLSSQRLEYRFYEHKAMNTFNNMIEQYAFQITQSGHRTKVQATILIDAIVIIDPQRIEQVISNLVGNAIRYTPVGGEISITCVTHINETLARSVPENDDHTIPCGELIFTIRDTGEGVPEKDLPRIFERSYSEGRRIPDPVAGKQGALVDKPSSDSQSGLGLFISTMIIKQHSGNMWAENHPNGGLEVSFSLPCYR